MNDKKQFDFKFDCGYTDLFPDFQDCLKASVYGCGKPFKAIAADLDMKPSELSRKLANNPNDPVHFPASRLSDLITATGDDTPIKWLAEKHIEKPEERAQRLEDEVTKMLPILVAYLEGKK